MAQEAKEKLLVSVEESIFELEQAEQNEIIEHIVSVVQERREMQINTLEKQIAIIQESYEKLKKIHHF